MKPAMLIDRCKMQNAPFKMTNFQRFKIESVLVSWIILMVEASGEKNVFTIAELNNFIFKSYKTSTTYTESCYICLLPAIEKK